MIQAGEAVQAAALAALRTIGGLGVFDGPPVQAAFPYVVADAGLEAEWSHKTGTGREVRLAVTIRDKGERPLRLRQLAGEAEAALEAVEGTYKAGASSASSSCGAGQSRREARAERRRSRRDGRACSNIGRGCCARSRSERG